MQYSDTSPYKVSENATLINATLADLNVVNDKSINATRDLFSNQFYDYRTTAILYFILHIQTNKFSNVKG